MLGLVLRCGAAPLCGRDDRAGHFAIMCCFKRWDVLQRQLRDVKIPPSHPLFSWIEYLAIYPGVVGSNLAGAGQETGACTRKPPHDRPGLARGWQRDGRVVGSTWRRNHEQHRLDSRCNRDRHCGSVVFWVALDASEWVRSQPFRAGSPAGAGFCALREGSAHSRARGKATTARSGIHLATTTEVDA